MVIPIIEFVAKNHQTIRKAANRFQILILKYFGKEDVVPTPEPISSNKVPDEKPKSLIEQKTGKLFFVAGTLTLVAVFIINQTIDSIDQCVSIDGEEVTLLIHGNLWITYEPIDYNPETNPNPDLNSIEQELQWIQQAGFEGIITFSSQGNFALIPQIAKEMGFHYANPVVFFSAIYLHKLISRSICYL